ncbi:MAG: hypothetical protein MPJ78_18785 [Hyphomicrobiaceae bacterium]|nr:hypothetical protein [Hyphomicrobiaceae bacterium]
MRIEQFVYTTAEINNRLGYQVVARSRGITDEIISEMDGYMHPAGINPHDFEESRSMRLLDGGLVAYGIARNVGIGHDGRPHTLYCHVFVVDGKEFAGAGYDTRVFDALYVEDKAVRGSLPSISLDLRPLPVRHDAAGEHDLGEALDPLFRGKNVAWIGGGKSLQDVLRMLPESLRLVPFSTLVLAPDRQPEYRLVACPEIVKYRLPKAFATVPGVHVPSRDVSRYARLIVTGQHDRVDRIQMMFDEQGVPGPDGLGLACDRDLHAAAPDAEKPGIARSILGRIWGLDDARFSKYVGEIRESLALEDPPHGWSKIPVSDYPKRDPAQTRHADHRPLSWWHMFGYDFMPAPQSRHLDWLEGMSKKGGRSVIRFTYGGYPRIVMKFNLADGVLRGIQAGGRSDGQLPQVATFDAHRIRDMEVAAGYGDGAGGPQPKIPALSQA